MRIRRLRPMPDKCGFTNRFACQTILDRANDAAQVLIQRIL